MGYRSEVYIGIKPSLKDEFEKIAGDYFEVESEQDDIIIYLGSWLKWYDSYDDVVNISKFVMDTDDGNFLVALGEDGIHHSEIGEWYDYLELVHTITSLKLKNRN